MMPNNFYSLVKEEPETISETDMDTNVLPPTSCGMQGHAVAGGVAPPHVVGAPMPPGLPLTPVTPTSMQPPHHLKYLDIDPNFEPVARSRSNTWPLPRPEGYIDGEEPSIVPTGDMPTPTDPARPLGILGLGQPGEPTGGGPKKNTSRRNPWGNMSYADLIAQAILSSPDHRATLSQVYDWMVQNVPYFKDKGDSNSSAGWKVSDRSPGGSDPLHTMKNSIRHNLSLHNRFMRVQNEGTGKSSWWVLNPDAKPGKSTRRRANTNPMEGGRFEKKRGRVKKKMEALRNGLDTTPSPSSSISENLDLYPDSPLTHPAFGQLSPQDFRPRASSNASSCGRLSPIPAIESDMHDAQVPPMSPGIGGWGPADYWGHHGPHLGHHLDRYTDQLVDSIGEGLKLGSADWANRHAHPNPSDCMKLTQLSPHGPHHPPPPPGLMNGFHPHHHHHPQGPYGSFEDFHRFGPHNTHAPNYSLPPAHQDKMHTPTRPPHPHSNYTLTNLQVRPQAMSPAHSAHSLSPTQPLGEGHYPGPGGEAHQPTSSFPSPPSSQPSPHSGVPTSEASNMLRQALQHRDQQQQQQQQQQRERDNQHREQQQREAQQETQQQQHREQQQQQQRSQTAGREGSTTSGSRSQGSSSSSGSGSSSSGGSSSSTGPGGQPMQDFVDLDTIQGGLECNVEEVIKHELQMGGSLDFSFPQAHHGHHAHTHAHAHHHHAHHQHMAADHSRPQMPGPPAMPPYNCNSIAAGNHWVR